MVAQEKLSLEFHRRTAILSLLLPPRLMPIMTSRRTWIIVAVVVVLLLAWSVLNAMSAFTGRKMVENMMERAANGEADVNVKADGTMDITTKDGTYSMGKDLPKDWPSDVPSYAGATVSYAASTNQPQDTSGMALVLLTQDSSADVQAFYEAELKSSGWDITNTMQGGGSTIMTAEKDGRTLSLVIAESDGQTGITLAVETTKK